MEVINSNGDQQQRREIRDSKGRTPQGKVRWSTCGSKMSQLGKFFVISFVFVLIDRL
ncbi:hypothetical protein COLO4_07453 [Corchorus olitorius]|uniref:Uncharacterized protein n=1 Tax=Corchorus olitorius TaxID=93759 RepID=A0A1R3KJP3_9ROSI|nr:hypothetical protein COLO4_07453 [Corchorus olitorius]